MKPFVVLYATREGHTRRIAEHIAMRIRERWHPARVRDVRHLDEPFELDGFAGAFVAASVSTSRDYELTDWKALDELVAVMIADTLGRTATKTARAAYA